MRGSIGDHTARLATAIMKLGHEAGILTDVAAEGAVLDGARVFPMIEKWDMRAWRKIARVAKDYDVLHLEYQAGAFGMGLPTQFLGDGMRLLTGGKPFVTTFHDLLAPYLFPKAGRLREWSVRHLARASDGVVATNVEDEQRLKGWGIERLWQIPIASPLPLEVAPDWDREAWRAKWKVGPQHKLVVYFGFVNRAKGLEALLHGHDGLLRAGQPVRVLMAGDPLGASDPSNAEYLAEIQELASNLNLNPPWLQWTGDLSEEELIQAILAADLVALPFREGANLRRSTLIMALSLGQAVLTTQPKSPIPFLKHKENIAFARPSQPADFAREMALLLRYEPSLKRLQRGAKALKQYFDWESIARQYVEVYEKVRG
jgi:glycosyltransferase involved in cell wall biosynthesis